MTEPIEIYDFDTLYCKDVKGKIKTWKIKVERYDTYSVIVTLYGYDKLIESRRKINSGKNLNKSNMTTPYTQALSEAKSKWTKKIDIEQFYAISDKSSENKNFNILPMLAHEYKKHKNKVIYPAIVQPKLDGMRMIYNSTTGKITTRQGKEYNIVKESGKLYQELQNLPKGLIFDGELYTNKLNFEVLGVLRKTKKLSNDDVANLQKIEYHIYDIIDTKITFEERNKIIQNLNLSQFEKLIYVDTYEVNNEDEIKNYHSSFLEKGFEGTMIRNINSLYKPKQRSTDLLKYKDFDDAEFEIIDFTVEKDTSGDDDNLIVWIISVPVENEMQNTFVKCKVRPQGTIQERKDLYKKCVENFDQFKGRKLWVKFYSKTSDGSLRFPSTLHNTYKDYIRDEIL